MSEYPRFTFPADIMIHMSDPARICRAADMMRFMQESATRQLEEYGPTMREMQSMGRAFILSRISIDFPEPAHTFERINCTTWPCSSSRGAAFERCFELLRRDTVVAVGMSQWALLDYRNRRLLRVEDADIAFTRDEVVETTLPLRFRIPKDCALVPVGEKTVLHSDIDTNHHMNNTRYCDLFCDFLPMDGMRVSALAVSFQKEAVLGEKITVLRSESPDADGNYYFRTLRGSDGAVNTEAVIKLV
ncbi:MAG: hypothetical protein IJ302_09070 [Clostridia bacterium]|nr:hypothetical protein [Clostridia bacterium]